MKCAFCDEPLICKECRRPFVPKSAVGHLAAYQPDMQLMCPECSKVLKCLLCGFVYGEEEEGNQD